ncbi:MAG TPA: hypothetical protein VHQ86_04405, partial [Candidatus Saccharimonadia bacterium]|nr:hypothetical protein [Candidatus Saccharimonadia bacterium]
ALDGATKAIKALGWDIGIMIGLGLLLGARIGLLAILMVMHLIWASKAIKVIRGGKDASGTPVVPASPVAPPPTSPTPAATTGPDTMAAANPAPEPPTTPPTVVG